MTSGSFSRSAIAPAADRAAVVYHGVPVGQTAGHLEVLVHQQDGHLGGEAPDGLHQFLDQDGRQSLAGLVYQQDAVIGDQGAGDGQHLLLPAGEVTGGQAGQSLQVREEGENEVGPLLQVSPSPLSDAEVLLHGEVGEDGPVLRDVADAHRRNLVGRAALNLLPGEDDLARARRGQPQDGFKGGRFTGAVAAQQRGDAPLRHLQRDALQDVELADKGVDVLNFQKCHSVLRRQQA
jgi:hypothetical protein